MSRPSQSHHTTEIRASCGGDLGATEISSQCLSVACIGIACALQSPISLRNADTPIGMRVEAGLLQTGRTGIRAVLVDEDDLARRVLGSALKNDADIQIVGESVSASDLPRLVNALRPDLVLMDIGTQAAIAIEVWRNLPDPHPYLIIVTSHPEFALQAFELHAGDYLIKPVQRRTLMSSLSRTKQRIAQRRVASFAMQLAAYAEVLKSDTALGADAPAIQYPSQMTVRVRRRMYSIDVNDIVWIQGASQYSRVHTRSGEFLLSRTLASMECELDPARFFRVHRSAIVNATFVTEVRSRGDGCYNIYLRGGQALPMGRARREILARLLGSIGNQENSGVNAPPAGSNSAIAGGR
jgi:two-component system LytT family response regulator